MSVSSLYSSDDSLSHPGIVWSGGTRSRGAEHLGTGTSSVSLLPYLVVMVWVCGAFKGYLTEPSGVTAFMGHVHVAGVVQVIGGESHLPGNGCAAYCWVGLLPCIMRGFTKHCW